ncbi:hypothetical protein MY8738_007314 [Beauveria namnaoensis]
MVSLLPAMPLVGAAPPRPASQPAKTCGGPDDAAVGLRLRRECNHEAYPRVAVGERASSRPMDKLNSLQPSFIIILLGLSRTNRVSDACISLQSLDLFINANM